jgi:hypothetical protein
MTTVAIDYIWQVIRETERSDEIQFMDDELLIKAEAPRVPHNLQDLFGDMGSGPGRKSIADAAISPALSALG